MIRRPHEELVSRGLEYDVLLTSGGVSVGAFDFVKEVQEELGVQRLLWGVAMKPGKPLVFGKRGGTLVFGLPGNPVSAMVSFELFVRPALLSLMGYRKTARPLYAATIIDELAALKERVNVVRVRVRRRGQGLEATSTGDQGSGSPQVHGRRKRTSLCTGGLRRVQGRRPSGCSAALRTSRNGVAAGCARRLL